MFFFKQKTAYEIGQCLEFRRVLFRSAALRPIEGTMQLPLPALDEGPSEIAADRNDFVYDSWRSLSSDGKRSEERRVGKECRWRWARYHQKKKETVRSSEVRQRMRMSS